MVLDVVWCGIAMFVLVVGMCSGGWGGRMMVVVVGGAGDAVEVGGCDDGGGWEGNSLFVNVMYVLFLANTTYVAQYKDTMVAYMIYHVKS